MGLAQPDDPSNIELAVRASDPETAAAMLVILLRHGANINALKGSSGPEWRACSRDEQHQTAIRLLIERGARTDSINGNLVENTLLHCGYYVHSRAMQYLLRVMCDRTSSRYIKGVLTSKQEAAIFGVWRVLKNIYWRIRCPVP